MGLCINELKSSFESMRPIAFELVDRFYSNLFLNHPEAEANHIKADTAIQKSALVGVFAAIIENIDKPEPLTKLLLEISANHASYSFTSLHFKWINQALLKTFSEFLGEKWTPELARDWEQVLDVVAEAIQTGIENTGREPTAEPKAEFTSVTRNRRDPFPMSGIDSGPIIQKNMTLSSDVKENIKQSVTTIVRSLVQAEVERCFEEHMQRLGQLTPQELLQCII